MHKKGISYQDLILDIPVNFYHINKLKIEQSLNHHAVAHITGILKEENQDAIHRLTSQTRIKIKVKSESTVKTIFCGIPVNVTMKHTYDGCMFSITVKSCSIQMDLQKKCRSFQNLKSTYHTMFETLIQEYGGDLLDKASKGAIQKNVLIQYEETDWEFLKRAASHVGAGIFPDVISDTPHIYIGFPEGNTYTEYGSDYCIEKNLENYLLSKNNLNDQIEQNFISYCFDSMEDYHQGDKITYQGTSFIIMGKITELKKGLLTYQYRLQKKNGLKQSIFYNSNLRGVSIKGKVLDIERDRLKVHLSIDSSQNLSEAAWFPFETLYATEGSTGWYSMPQKGDSVGLYIPSTDEKELYIRNVNRQDGTTNSKVKNPKVKYYGTNHGNEIKMSPKEFTFHTAGKSVCLKMDNHRGIRINSDRDIHIKGQKQLFTESETMEIKSNEKILIATQSAGIIVDDIVHIKS